MRKRGKWSTTFERWRKNDVDNVDSGDAGCAFTRVLRGRSTRFTGGRAEEQTVTLALANRARHAGLFHEPESASDVASAGGARRLCGRFPDLILGRQQLFTENTLTVILPLLLHKDRTTMMKVLRLWGIVLSANIVGTFLFAAVVARGHFLEPGMQQSLMEVAATHIGPEFWTVLLRALFAGWLVALMVWMLPDAASSRVVVILIIMYLIGIASLNHVIAGSATVFYLVSVGKLSLGRYFTAFFSRR